MWPALLGALAAVAVHRARWAAFTVERAVPVRSRLDGRAYRVQPAHAGADEAADDLAAINARVVELLRALRARYARADAPGARRDATARLLARYSPDALAENSPLDPSGDTSYCLDKGALVALCLRARAAGHARHDLGVLTFVALHELAHIAVREVDHPPAFWRAFRWLLEEAAAAGVYRAPDFAAAPVEYCGIRVDYNPALDPGVGPFGAAN